MIEYKTQASKDNYCIQVETDNYKYYRLIEEFIRMFIDHKLDFINDASTVNDTIKTKENNNV